MFKICSKCKLKKKIINFRNQIRGKFGVRGECRLCESKYNKSRNLLRKEYYKNNKENIQKSKRKWIKKNPNYMNDYFKCRSKIDKKFNILLNLRSRITKSLKRTTKSLNTIFLIGCEVDYLMYHLQEQFKEGMSWDNYGDWEIDHIIPCKKFDFRKKSEQLKCFHYTNLQPLWLKEHKEKTNREKELV